MSDMNLGSLNISHFLSQFSTQFSNIKGLFGKAAAGASINGAISKPSPSTAALANQAAIAAARSPLLAEEAGLEEISGPFKIVKKEPPKKAEGERKLATDDEKDSEALFNELSAGTEEGGAGGEAGAGAGEEGADGKRFAGGQQMVELLKHLDPNAPGGIEGQIEYYLTHPAWKTENGQARIGEFLATHLTGGNDTKDPEIRVKVESYRRSASDKAALKAIQKEMAAKGFSPEQQIEIEKEFQRYCATFSADSGSTQDWSKLKNEFETKGLEIIETFDENLLEKAGAFLRNPNLSTFDDRAAIHAHTTIYKVPNAIKHFREDMKPGIRRIYPQLSSQRTQYTKD